MNEYKLPVKYDSLNWEGRKAVRGQYVAVQQGKCLYCEHLLSSQAPDFVKSVEVDMSLFPSNFFKYPIHIQHNHETGMTEGVVHNICNAVLWQLYGV